MPKKPDKWEFYRDKADHWRWRRKAGNGRIVGSSSQGYHSRDDCEANAMREGWQPEPKEPQDPVAQHPVATESQRVADEGRLVGLPVESRDRP